MGGRRRILLAPSTYLKIVFISGKIYDSVKVDRGWHSSLSVTPNGGRENMVNFGSVTRHTAVEFAALASLVLLAAPLERAFADKPSTPVTVVNPNTSPVPTTVVNPSTSPALTSSVDDPGRVAYQSEQTGSSFCFNNDVCDVSFTTVPTGQRLVIQHISGAVETDSSSVVLVQLSPGVPPGVSSFFGPPGISGIGSNSLFQSYFDQPVLVYVDTGQTPSVSISIATGAHLKSVDVTLSGYLLDCNTATPCAAIAH
jgi:hypothetical protein